MQPPIYHRNLGERSARGGLGYSLTDAGKKRCARSAAAPPYAVLSLNGASTVGPPPASCGWFFSPPKSLFFFLRPPICLLFFFSPSTTLGLLRTLLPIARHRLTSLFVCLFVLGFFFLGHRGGFPHAYVWGGFVFCFLPHGGGLLYCIYSSRY